MESLLNKVTKNGDTVGALILLDHFLSFSESRKNEKCPSKIKREEIRKTLLEIGVTVPND